MKKPDFTLRPVIAGLLLFGSTVASASSITVAGTDANFTFDDSLLGIFGTPTMAGNILYFTPVDFSALSTNGDGTVLTQSAINVLVTPNQGVKPSSLGLDERGAYSLNGEGSYVGVGGQISAFDVANPITAENTANIIRSSDLATHDNGMHSWVLPLSI